MRPLIDLIRASPDPLEYPPASTSLPITGLTSDSRQVHAGHLFAALKGVQSDGSAFVPKAEQAGAVAILCDNSADIKTAMTVVRAENPRRTFAYMAAAFYQGQPQRMVAVTGTDGKTSTADFFRQFCEGLGHKSASIGTLGALGPGGEELAPGMHTTPDPVALHRLLSDMKMKSITHACMEASSHGLHQYRLDGVKLDAGAFTNIARDHFDYHKTEEDYFAAKSRLFSEVLPEGATAVLNQDDARFGALQSMCKKRGMKVIGFGKAGEQFKIERLTPHHDGQDVNLVLNGKPHALSVPLVGAFQVMNILAAMGLVTAVGGDLEKTLAVVPKLKGVPGRLEQVVKLKNGAAVFIDYAHTPMALSNILTTLRPHTMGKLHVVFGCGGDRDPGKRPEMGKIADKMADVITITDDNPRSEDPALIRKAIASACPRGKEVADRKEAIYAALKSLEAKDILAIAGKGHEKTQIVGSTVHPFNDAQVAREGAKELRLI